MNYFWALLSLCAVGVLPGARAFAGLEANVRFPDADGKPNFPIQIKEHSVQVQVVQRPTTNIPQPKPTPKPTATPFPSSSPSPTPRTETKPEDFDVTVRIQALLIESNVSVFFRNQVIATSDNKPVEMNFVVKLSGEKTEFVLTKVDARGAIQKMNGEVTFDGWDGLFSRGEPKPWSVIPALGLTYYSYTETTVGTLNILGLTFKLTGSYRLGDRFDLGINSYITALPLYTSDATRTTRFFGLNARLGYRTSWLPSPWAFYIKGGYYYTTMLVAPSDHGFTNMNGPQIYPVLTRKIGKGMGHFYMKYSPIAQLSLANREIAGGLGYHWSIQPQRTMSVELDIANIGFSAPDQTGATRTTNCWSFTLTGGYRF